MEQLENMSESHALASTGLENKGDTQCFQLHADEINFMDGFYFLLPLINVLFFFFLFRRA